MASMLIKGGDHLPKLIKKWKCEAGEDVRAQTNPMKVMIFVSQLHRRTLEQLVGETGLHRGQHRMLMTLSEHEFGSQTELANGLEISAATVAVSLKKLEKGGYIRKTVKEDDCRAHFVQLTEKGKDIVESSRETFHQIDREAVKGFSEEELDALRQYLWRMYDNLSAYLKE